MEANDSMPRFLSELGCRRRGDRFILDGFDNEFYLMFDLSADPENQESIGTVDIYVSEVGEVPSNREGKIRLVQDANRFGVMRMLSAIGIQRFSDATKTAYYKLGNPLRTV